MLALILIALIALLHVYILVVEMFLWDRPYGLKAFGNTPEKARITKVMAQNQGLYNGFLAAGLFLGIVRARSVICSTGELFSGLRIGGWPLWRHDRQ